MRYSSWVHASVAVALGSVLVGQFAGCDSGTEAGVGSNAENGAFSGLPGSISQAITEGTATPVKQPLRITNRGSCPMTWSATVITANGLPWLSLDPNSGTALASGASTDLLVYMSAVAGQVALPPGTHAGTLLFVGTCDATGVRAQGSPAAVSVNMTITGNQAVLDVDGGAIEQDIVPLTNQWTSVNAPLPQGPNAGTGAAAVWTGRNVLVYGNTAAPANAYMFDPATEQWTAQFNVAVEHVSNTCHAWTGTELLLWAGLNQSNSASPGGHRYNPTTGVITALSTQGAPDAGADCVAVWTGQEFIVWGGHTGQGYSQTGGRYNPTTNTWQPIATVGSPFARRLAQAVWTGQEMIVWGGFFNAAPNTSLYLNDGAAYNPTSNTWRTLATATGKVPSGRSSFGAIWSGAKMYVFGGYDGTNYLADGGAYDPFRNEWSSLPSSGAPSARASANLSWTGSRLIVLGGYNVPLDGALIGRNEPAWTPISAATNGVPSGVLKAVWTGTELIVGPNGGTTYILR